MPPSSLPLIQSGLQQGDLHHPHLPHIFQSPPLHSHTHPLFFVPGPYACASLHTLSLPTPEPETVLRAPFGRLALTFACHLAHLPLFRFGAAPQLPYFACALPHMLICFPPGGSLPPSLPFPLGDNPFPFPISARVHYPDLPFGQGDTQRPHPHQTQTHTHLPTKTKKDYQIRSSCLNFKDNR